MKWAAGMISILLMESGAVRATAVEDFEALIANHERDWRKIRDCHRRLFADAAKSHFGHHTAGMLGELSWANREYITSLVRSRKFKEAAVALKTHVDFCEKEGAGLYGRYERNWIDFVQLHARVWSELGQDPLKGRNLYYQLSEDGLGYHAYCLPQYDTDKRHTTVGPASWEQIPPDQTTGKCILMDHLGRMTSEVDVGFTWPSNERSLGKRLKSVYEIGDPPLRLTIRAPRDLLTRPRHPAS